MHKRLLTLTTFVQRRPLFFNSLVYGSFYTGAEFIQQYYNKKFQAEQSMSQPVLLIEHDDRKEISSSVLKWFHAFNERLGLNEDYKKEFEDYNWAQLKRYAIYGCLLAGPTLHVWYKWLDSFYKGTSMYIIGKKLIADQFILTPPLIITFFISMSIMENNPNIFDECRLKFVKTFQTSCMYWIPIQFINFMVVPPALRVIYVSVAAFCWVNILCYLKRLPINDSISQRK